MDSHTHLPNRYVYSRVNFYALNVENDSMDRIRTL